MKTENRTEKVLDNECIDIVALVNENPLTKLNGSFESKLLNKIKENFNEDERKIYITSLYCYLKYNPKDYLIDLDNIWAWLGFSQKVRAKELLTKHFEENTDYILKSFAFSEIINEINL